MLLGGCTDDGSNQEAAPWGVPDSTVANTMTQAQAEAACVASHAYATAAQSTDDLKKGGCMMAAMLGDESMGATCQEIYDTCMAQETEATASGDCAGSEPLQCAVTIGEIRGCYEAMIDGQVGQLTALASATCDTIQDLITNPPAKYVPTAECEKVMADCELGSTADE